MENNIKSVAVALTVATATAAGGQMLGRNDPPPAKNPEPVALKVFDLEEGISGADVFEGATSDTEVAAFFVFSQRRR